MEGLCMKKNLMKIIGICFILVLFITQFFLETKYLMAQSEPKGASMENEDNNISINYTILGKYIHKYLGIELNNLVWKYLDKDNRTEQENNKMINAAHASLYHWSEVGKPENFARGEWLVSHVYSVLNRPEPALYHAKNCMNITKESDLVDFDLAYAYEAMARAYAANENKKEYDKYIKLAEEAGNKIKEVEDRKIFFSDFQAQPWYGMK